MPAALARITFDPGMIGLKLYPYLEEEDIRQALAYAAWRAEECAN
jgi:hypothetical protein